MCKDSALPPHTPTRRWRELTAETGAYVASLGRLPPLPLLERLTVHGWLFSDQVR